MKNIELGTTGEKVSQLVLGCMGLGTLVDDRASFALLDRYAQDGGTFLDTADCYSWFHRPGIPGGQSEEVIGRWLARSNRRDRTFISTKGSAMVADVSAVWRPGRAPAALGDGEGPVRRRRYRCAAHLTRRQPATLGTDHVDLYFVHVDDRATPLPETLQTLADFVAEARSATWAGRTCAHGGWNAFAACARPTAGLSRWPCSRSIPISHAGPARARLDRGRRAARLPARAPRPQLDRLLRPAQGSVRRSPAERDRHPALAPYAGDEARHRLAVVDAIAAEIGVQPGQIVLAWLAAQISPRRFALIGTTQVDRYRQAARALELELTPDQLARLDRT